MSPSFLLLPNGNTESHEGSRSYGNSRKEANPRRTDNLKGHGIGWACCSKMTDGSISLAPREILRSRDSRTTTNDVIIIFHYWCLGSNAEYLGNYVQTHFRGVVNGMQ